MFETTNEWIGLRENWNRKAPYLMGKSMVSDVNFPLNQSNQSSNGMDSNGKLT